MLAEAGENDRFRLYKIVRCRFLVAQYVYAGEVEEIDEHDGERRKGRILVLLIRRKNPGSRNCAGLKFVAWTRLR